MIKSFIMLQKISISDKCFSFELSINQIQRNLKKNILRCYNIVINVFFLSNKSEYRFLKNHVTEVMMLKIQL